MGPLDTQETVRHLPIYKVPFTIGRRGDLPLSLACKTVSSVHAEITESGGVPVLRDLGSTNGTYVNGRRIARPVTLCENDIVQFAGLAFRVHRQAGEHNMQTVCTNVCDGAMALVQFDKLMAERAVTPFFQPIVSMLTRNISCYEVLARSRLFGLKTPKEMFHVAAQMDLEAELSEMLRREGVQASRDLAPTPHLFLNTHPGELVKRDLIPSLQALREQAPEQRLTLEIHESAVTDSNPMAKLRAALTSLDIGLAYDDFGAGRSRLNELTEYRPEYVKFDISLIRGIDAASPQRQRLVASLVQMVHNLGIVSLAEGVETEAESQTCLEMGFVLGQGFLYGRPAPVTVLAAESQR